MFDWLKRLFAPPVYEDKDTNSKARLLNTILLSTIVLLTILWFARLPTSDITDLPGNALILAGMIVFLIGAYVITRFRYLQFGTYAMIFGIWTTITLLAGNASGVKDASFMGYLVIILMASLLSGWRLAAVLTGLTVVAGWGFVYGESVGFLAIDDSIASFDIMTDYTFILGLSGVMIYLLISRLQTALQNSQQSNQELQALSQELESKVSSRTQALETSLLVSRQLTTILDQNELAAEVVNQVQSAFNYYHAQMYLFDEAGRDLLLVGGTGEAGRAMLAREHKISGGQGLVGQAAAKNQVVLVPDTAAAGDWLPNPLLPQTKAEIAVPISLGEQVLGVMDVQHDVTNGLTNDDTQLLESVAAQVAIALRNARLYGQAEQQANQETIINEIGQQIRSAANVEMVLQVAARELAQKLGTPRASIEISRDAIMGNGRNPKRN